VNNRPPPKKTTQNKLFNPRYVSPAPQADYEQSDCAILELKITGYKYLQKVIMQIFGAKKFVKKIKFLCRRAGNIFGKDTSKNKWPDDHFIRPFIKIGKHGAVNCRASGASSFSAFRGQAAAVAKIVRRQQ